MKKGQFAILITVIVLLAGGIFGYVYYRMDKIEKNKTEEKENNNKEDTINESLIGNWYIEKSDLSSPIYYKFNANGTGEHAELGAVDTFRYTIKGNVLSINYNYASYSYEYAINNNILVLKSDDGNIIELNKKIEENNNNNDNNSDYTPVTNQEEKVNSLVWKMVVNNENGATIYANSGLGIGDYIISTDTSLAYGTVLDIVGDFYYDENWYEATFTNIDDIKDYYYLQYKCDAKDPYGHTNNCYVKYNDLKLSKFTNGYDEDYKYTSSKKGLLTNRVDIYEGPGLMFKKTKANIDDYKIIDINYFYNDSDWAYIDYNGIKGWAYIMEYRDIDYHYSELFISDGIGLGRVLDDGKITTRKITKLYDESGNIIGEIPANTTLAHNLVFSDIYGVFYKGRQGYIKTNLDDKVCNEDYDEFINCDFEILNGYVGP